MATIKKLDRWLASIPLWLFVLISTASVVVKAGVSFAPLDNTEFQNFPFPPNYWSALSYGMRSIVFFTGQRSELTFSVVGILLTIGSVAAIAYFANQRLAPTPARLFIMLVLIGPIGMVLFNRIGQNDVLVIMGALIAAFSGQRILIFILGIALMLLGNPEQTIIALLALLILSLVPELRRWMWPSIVGLILAVVTFFSLSALARSTGARNRMEYLPDYLSNSFYGFAANLPLSLYAGLGAVWLVVAWVLVRVTRKERLWVILALAVLPFTVTMITVDQTRVYVGVSALAVFVLLLNYLPGINSTVAKSKFPAFLGLTFLALLFLPIIDIWGSSGHARTPYLWIFTSVVPQVKTLIVG